MGMVFGKNWQSGGDADFGYGDDPHVKVDRQHQVEELCEALRHCLARFGDRMTAAEEDRIRGLLSECE